MIQKHQTFWKDTVSATVQRRKKRLERVSAEEKTMRAVRKRDIMCRFPLCGCRKLQLRLEVSHQRHRGMGGNPTGDRTTEETMVLVCSARHRGNLYSIDNGSIWWVARTKDGANGPIDWYAHRDGRDILLAREASRSVPHVYDVSVKFRRVLLEALATLEM